MEDPKIQEIKDEWVATLSRLINLMTVELNEKARKFPNDKIVNLHRIGKKSTEKISSKWFERKKEIWDVLNLTRQEMEQLANEQKEEIKTLIKKLMEEINSIIESEILANQKYEAQYLTEKIDFEEHCTVLEKRNKKNIELIKRKKINEEEKELKESKYKNKDFWIKLGTALIAAGGLSLGIINYCTKTDSDFVKQYIDKEIDTIINERLRPK